MVIEEVQAKGIENIFKKIKAKRFPDLEKEMIIQLHECFRTPSRLDLKETLPHHIIVET
jgi:hypothetical protein